MRDEVWLSVATKLALCSTSSGGQRLVTSGGQTPIGGTGITALS